MRRAIALGLALVLVSTAAWSTDLGSLVVDAREAPRGVMQAHQTLKVSPGPLTLVYPKWLPGRHSPAGPATSFGAPRFSVKGAPLAWRRDDVDLYAFHLTVPSGVSELDCDLEILTLPAPDGVVQGTETPRTATDSLLILEWNQLMLYPEGARSDDLTVAPAVRLPSGWQFASALDPKVEGEVVTFAPVSLTTLVDSTLLAGRHFSRIELGGTPPVTLNIAADAPVALAISAETKAHYQALVREAQALFGATHYRRYEFLWALTDQIMPDGLEHHESSDDRSPLRALIDDEVRLAEANLLPHEYTHSWNGKYRRPQGLSTPNYQEPMKDELLFVYEGLTEYLSDVLSARSGLFTETHFRDEMARLAALMDSHKGRAWRSLQDTLIAAPLVYYQARGWAARLRRQDDFYQESALLWLEADALIRRGSAGKKSLDDFCRGFFGGASGAPRVEPYDFSGVVAALNAVYPYDWAGFWRERLERLRPQAPLEGLRAAGWDLALTATPSSQHVAHESDDRSLDLRYSLGFYVDDDGATLGDVIPDSSADRAQIAPGSHVIALNGYKWSKELLHSILGQGVDAGHPLSLLIEKDDMYKTVTLDYVGGERYPNLIRLPAQPDLLGKISQPLAGSKK